MGGRSKHSGENQIKDEAVVDDYRILLCDRNKLKPTGRSNVQLFIAKCMGPLTNI